MLLGIQYWGIQYSLVNLVWDTLLTSEYRIVGLFCGRKFSQILRICPSSRKYYSQILHVRATPACTCSDSGGVADGNPRNKSAIQ